ncbi:MAG: DUF4199 domain-containing protein [Cyclobacteriaceae bacterium]|uniref:DUF4199 domain-containing protein n=1 Tax=Algoriphagus marincola TaxID=264027 RepID=A0ABS7N939_9BACT|nr:DUF4199 domain-containing protein [Algoriphagus marincola]MBY5952856.1 DUF4199 domain-containing protein [Algoriphagus marincola]MCR9084703.1 DUF4199 domain-containing protein [Cyclobacteriaceae bacterium]
MNKYLSSAYQFGTLGGILSLISFGFLAWVQPDPTNLNLIFGYIITPVSIFLALKFFKDYSNNGYLSFAEGMSVGFVTYMLIAIISALGIWIILVLFPDLFEIIKVSKIQVMEQSKDTIISQVGEESFQATQKSIQEMASIDIAINDGIWKIVPGLFFTIIISIIFRKNPN